MTDRMTEETAREIVRMWNEVPPKDAIEREARWVSLNQSIGYLQALEDERAKAKGLVEALGKISKVTQFDHPKSQIIGSEEYEGAWLDCVDLAKEALARYKGKDLP